MDFSWGEVSVRPGRAAVYIIVPKKIFPRAVDRNRVKRRFRAALQKLNLPKAHVRLNPARASLTVPFALIVQDLTHALK